MRVVSWLVIVGSVSAILFGGVRPLLPSFGLLDVDASSVAGTMARQKESPPVECEKLDRTATENPDAEGEDEIEGCKNPKLVQK